MEIESNNTQNLSYQIKDTQQWGIIFPQSQKGLEKYRYRRLTNNSINKAIEKEKLICGLVLHSIFQYPTQPVKGIQNNAKFDGSHGIKSNTDTSTHALPP